jgi:Fe-S cluster assembly protein SufD
MLETMSGKDVYLMDHAQFQKEQGDGDPGWLQRTREAAVERFAELGFPTARDEDWKFTSVARLAEAAFGRPPVECRTLTTGRELFPSGAAAGPGLLCMNDSRPSVIEGSLPLPRGVILCSLAQADRDHADLVKPHLGKVADYEHHAFTALNTAFLRDGAFIYVPPGTLVEVPIYLRLGVGVFSLDPYVWYRRALVVLGKGSQATVVEEYRGLPRTTYFTSAVTEVVLGESAVLDHYTLQQEGDAAFHVAATQVQQERGSNFSTHYLGFGGSLVRNEVRVRFEGEGAEATVNGLYLASGAQHMDNHTVIDHAKPHCASHELYKGILNDRARGVFNGKIFVRPDAQKTDAKQTNQTLLLSEDATINTKPQLEIYADDVKCTHGATVGNLDEEQLFYLRARGIDLAAARALLTFAFANDIVGRIKVEPLRGALERQLLPAGQEAEEAV